MIEIDGIPLLERQINKLTDIGIKKIMYIIILQTFIISSLLTITINLIATKYSNEAQTLKNISLNKALSDKDLWFRSSNYIVNVNKVITDKRLEDIIIYNIRDGLLINKITAEIAFFNQ